ncbi:long-chain fatty acid--CoA ligase [Chromatiales bacterium (ex Bugula neritina AB1)]|nr:long-chain fatty acid--CoA ligase [Chromatiales bacterium (ex Bugula neritina AB1)]
MLTDAVATCPHTTALINGTDSRFSWADLAVSVEAAVELLQQQHIRPGDRVLLVFENCLSVVAFLYAASQLDALSVVVNARVTDVELQRVVTHCDPAAVVFSVDVSTSASEHAARMKAEPVTGSFGEVAISQRSGTIADTVFEEPDQQVAVLLYTSGTTGAPKAAMLTHQNLISGAIASATLRGSREGDVCYLVLPLSHVFGLVTLFAMTSCKATIRLEPRFDVARLYDALNQDVTIFPAVPQMHARLFQYARERNIASYTHGRLRYVSSGGAPLDPTWKREAENFYGMAMQNGYGLSETSAGVCATRNSIGENDISVGVPMGECVLKLDLDSVGANPQSGIGEVMVKGPQVMKGYYRDPQQTALVIDSEGYFRTGDLGWIDEHGNLHIAGRSKELIIRSGFNVYPVEVEAALTTHPEVVLAAVVGRAVEGNEEVLAFVQVAPGCKLTEDQLKKFVSGQLAPYKRPSRIIVTEELPVAATGKILKSKLIDVFSGELLD